MLEMELYHVPLEVIEDFPFGALLALRATAKVYNDSFNLVVNKTQTILAKKHQTARYLELLVREPNAALKYISARRLISTVPDIKHILYPELYVKLSIDLDVLMSLCSYGL